MPILLDDHGPMYIRCMSGCGLRYLCSDLPYMPEDVGLKITNERLLERIVDLAKRCGRSGAVLSLRSS